MRTVCTCHLPVPNSLGCAGLTNLFPWSLKPRSQVLWDINLPGNQKHSLAVWFLPGDCSVAAPGRATLRCFHLLPPVPPPAQISPAIPNAVWHNWSIRGRPPCKCGVHWHYGTTALHVPMWLAPRIKAGDSQAKECSPSQVSATHFFLKAPMTLVSDSSEDFSVGKGKMIATPQQLWNAMMTLKNNGISGGSMSHAILIKKVI